ncbi:very short patch repair endonuclease [Cytobacillus gottheilii]|uniref:Very short patch repair endonuclease n=1 Tax=Cytobacillus gottheilii TaxID=859144 RepID=A0ABX8FF30_9BACI|nr:very short patch repair endonuclease [Cytobacillus gottheilii]QVY62607.1 very short patch repair endonuclease [Cytobacillus gottheilii]
MPDKLTKQQRSNNMRAIKSQSMLENAVTKALWKRGFRFRKNTKMFGKPDISIKKYKIVIFIDSCFWHCCPIHGNMPNSNQEYWTKKLARNVSRDQEVNQFYTEKGWNVMRIWEHEFKKNFDNAVNSIADFIRHHKLLKEKHPESPTED